MTEQLPTGTGPWEPWAAGLRIAIRYTRTYGIFIWTLPPEGDTAWTAGE